MKYTKCLYLLYIYKKKKNNTSTPSLSFHLSRSHLSHTSDDKLSSFV